MYTTKSDKMNRYGESTKPMIWRNPVDNVLYASYKVPTLGFKEAGAWAIYDVNAHLSNIKVAQKGQPFTDNAFLDSEFANTVDQYISDVNQGGRVREAALRSSDNSAVDIVNIWTEVLGKKDRKYAGKNMAKEIPTPNLLISIDTATKFGGMVRIDEGQPGGIMKELRYNRSTFTAKKYGLKFVIHEESRLKNHHNVLQDSIQVASTKVEQRQSFDTVAALAGLTDVAAIGVWDTFVTSTDRSVNDPLADIGKIQLIIEGSNVGGKLTRVGMHPLTNLRYKENSFIRGVASSTPVGYEFEPGTTNLQGVEGVGLVLDPSFEQGKVYLVDTEVEPTVAFFQGPQRIGSEHDQETGDDKYFIIDYHDAQVIQAETGRELTGAMTPLAWS